MKKRIEKKILKLLDKIEKNEKLRLLFCNSIIIFIIVVVPIGACYIANYLANLILL